MSKKIVVDTNIILNCPQLIRSLPGYCDMVYIPRTVIRELNYQKDHGDSQRKTLASLCLGMLIEMKSDDFIIYDSNAEGNNDDKIWETAISIAKGNQTDRVFLLTNDKDFKLKNDVGTDNLRVIDTKEFDAEFKKTHFYNIQQSQKFCDAVKMRNIEYAKKILDSTVNVNYVESQFGYTPLIHAIRNRDMGMIEWLLSVPNVDINQVDEKKYKIPPISHAVQINNINIVKLLIRYGANINEPSLNNKNFYNTPLMIASWHGNLEMVRLLVESGACINQVDKGNGFSALIKAVFNNHPKVVKYLLECHADKTICSFEKKTALDYAYSNNENGNYEEIIALLNS